MENTQDNNDLFNFAYCGNKDAYNNMLGFLAGFAEPEKWTFDINQPNEILYRYIKKTFKQCYSQNKILYTVDNKFACFNTGLLTVNGNDIVMLFDENTNAKAPQKWHLKGFKDITQREFLNVFEKPPELASYFDKFEELYFNPEYTIILNNDHILDDNWDRIHNVVPFLSKNIIKGLLSGILQESQKRIKRNMRLVVPQFFNNQIMFLLPINIPTNDESYITMALAVEPTANNQYRANTIFTKEMAYEKARLLMKPESNWLMS